MKKLNAKEIRKIVREGLFKGADRNSLYVKARLIKQVLLFDPEYGDLSGTAYDHIDYDSFLIALQAMSNALKINIWQAAELVKPIRDLAVDEENFQFHMPATKEVIEALK